MTKNCQRAVRQVLFVVGSFVLHLLSMGISLSFGVIYSELLNVFEVEESEIGWVASLFSGLFLGTGLVGGILVSAFGVCLTTVIGSLLMTVGMVSSAFTSSPYLLYLTFGVTAGCGASFILVPANVIINEEFTDRRTVAKGIASTGGSIGNVVLPLFTSWCIELYGWRGSFILLGGLCLQGIVAGLLFYGGRKRAASMNKEVAGQEKPFISPSMKKCRKYFSFLNPHYLCFVGATTFGCVGYFIPFNLLYNMMITRGQTRQHSSLALSLAGAGSIVSRVLFGFLGDYPCIHRVYYMIFASILCAATSALCVHLTEFWQFLSYGFLYGMGAGVFSFLVSVLAADLAGVEHIRPAYGFVITMQGIGASIGTPAGGWLVEATASYNGSFYFTSGSFLLCGIMCALIPLSWRFMLFGKEQTLSTKQTQAQDDLELVAQETEIDSLLIRQRSESRDLEQKNKSETAELTEEKAKISW